MEVAPGGGPNGRSAASRTRLGDPHEHQPAGGDHCRAMGRLSRAIHLRKRRPDQHERHSADGVTPMSIARPRTRGFSIVELMVAITLALIVTAAVMSAF